MKVQVKVFWGGVRSKVGQETIAPLIYAHFMRQLRSSHEDFGKYRSILERQVRHGGYMTAGNYKDVVVRLRVDILKRHDIVVLIDNFAGYLASRNLTEKAVLHTTSSKLFFLGVCAIGRSSSGNFYWFSSCFFRCRLNFCSFAWRLCCYGGSFSLLLLGLFRLFLWFSRQLLVSSYFQALQCMVVVLSY